jgi:signal transduction histidine kinase
MTFPEGNYAYLAPQTVRSASMGDAPSIERIFLRNLLRIILGGILLILVTDILIYFEDTLSIVIDVVILVSVLLSFALMKKFYTASVMIVCCVTLATMVYQCLVVPINTTTSMSVILIVGFLFSILLSGKFMWAMHIITGACILGLFVIQIEVPSLSMSSDTSEVITIAITYGVLYFILAYCTVILKSRYDQINFALRLANVELISKANEIEAQHEELIQSHESLNELNRNLEKMVMERTQKVHDQNQMLLKYTYTNAHHLRGPVARLLGLINVHKLDPNPDYNFFMSKMEDQAMEIDNVVKQINEELESSPL